MPKGERGAAKTHCPQGHPYDAQNTRVSNGMRFCRRCDSDKQKARRRAGGRVVVPHAERTHCPAGHEYTEVNTRISAGSRFCRTCDREKHVAEDIARPEVPMWEKARQRATRVGVPFEIEPEDVVIPPCCPVLGIALVRNTGIRGPQDASPSLDRLRPSEGYVRGNIAVISNRANRIKTNATLEELERVTAWLRAVLIGGVDLLQAGIQKSTAPIVSPRVLWAFARVRARKAGVPFEIQCEDVVIPSHCPVLGVLLQRGEGSGGFLDASPSLDRIVPSKGYVRENIAVISHKANRIKTDATLEELERVAAWLRATLKTA